MVSWVIPILGILSLGSLVLFLRGTLPRNPVRIYTIIFLILLLGSGGLKVYVESGTEGRTLSTMNPLSWLVIREDDSGYIVEEYQVLEGTVNQTRYEKYQNVTPSELKKYGTRPELQRLTYFSDITVAEKNATRITFSDPLRTHRLIWYPPYYSQVSIETR
jgi:hypothetical protein